MSDERPILRPPSYWEQHCGIEIRDPDGWRIDGKPFDAPISEEEFHRRAALSTARHRRAEYSIYPCKPKEATS